MWMKFSTFELFSLNEKSFYGKVFTYFMAEYICLFIVKKTCRTTEMWMVDKVRETRTNFMKFHCIMRGDLIVNGLVF